tara:strand:+ start:205 stop:846 length:642 start_codon:yes stop_codon:yes gene_type:complete
MVLHCGRVGRRLFLEILNIYLLRIFFAYYLTKLSLVIVGLCLYLNPMKSIIEANIYHLNQLRDVLQVSLNNKQYTSSNFPPFYSSIGQHTRHILDFYSNVLDYDKIIDLTCRNRSCTSGLNLDFALNRINNTIYKLNDLKSINDFTINVYDDLGLGKQNVNYNYSSLLAHANSHIIHHFASIGYLLHHLNIKPSNPVFGLNPTSPILRNKVLK